MILLSTASLRLYSENIMTGSMGRKYLIYRSDGNIIATSIEIKKINKKR